MKLVLSVGMTCPSETSTIPLINSQFLWATSKVFVSMEQNLQ